MFVEASRSAGLDSPTVPLGLSFSKGGSDKVVWGAASWSEDNETRSRFF